MKDMREEKIEALETLAEYNERVLKNIPILIKELSGQRLDDTEKFLDGIINAINWEVEVVNVTLDLLNEGKERIQKEDMNDKIVLLSEAIKKKDDVRMAQAFQQLIPVLENLGIAAKEVIG
ncbi:MAG: molecular chaperone [Acetivibrio ethanolgignens]